MIDSLVYSGSGVGLVIIVEVNLSSTTCEYNNDLISFLAYILHVFLRITSPIPFASPQSEFTVNLFYHYTTHILFSLINLPAIWSVWNQQRRIESAFLVLLLCMRAHQHWRNQAGKSVGCRRYHSWISSCEILSAANELPDASDTSELNSLRSEMTQRMTWQDS
jgi:hypothetical protein